jgi:hypothetical protein
MEPEPEPEAAAPAAAGAEREARGQQHDRLQRLQSEQPVSDGHAAAALLAGSRSEGAGTAAAAVAPMAEGLISEAFAAAGGTLDRDGIKALMQQLGRFEGWVDTALAKIYDSGLQLPTEDLDATVDEARFARWWSDEGSVSPSDALDKAWDAYASRIDRLCSSVGNLLDKMPGMLESSKVGRAELRRTVSNAATAELLGRPLFPMYVVSVSDVLAMDAPIVPHEEMMRRGLLSEVVELDDELGNFVLHHVTSSGERGAVRTRGDDGNCDSSSSEWNGPAQYSRNRFIAVSHQWLRPSRDPMVAHPDSEDAVKLTALKHYLREKSEGSLPDFLWMDYMSIPQSPDARDCQMLAINSIPTYFMYSTTLLVVMPTGCFDDASHGYLSRGHCLLELATSRLPRIDMFGKWYIPGSEATGQWGSVVVLNCTTLEAERVDQFGKQELAAASFQSPISGNFTVEADRSLVGALVHKYVQHHEFVEAQVLAPLRGCKTFAEYALMELPDCLRLQTFSSNFLGGRGEEEQVSSNGTCCPFLDKNE